MKKILILFNLFLIVILCGCMFNNSITLEEKMIQFLNDKYTEDEFTYSSPFGGGAGSDSIKIIASSKRYPNKKIFVVYFDGKFTDNYLGVKYEEQTRKYLYDIIDNVLDSEFLLFYDVDMYACPNPDGILSFDEYISKRVSGIGFTVVAKEMVGDKVAFEKSLEKAMVDAGISSSGTIYFDNSSGEFESLDSKNLSGYLFRGLYSDVFNFVMEDNNSFAEKIWGDV